MDRGNRLDESSASTLSDEAYAEEKLRNEVEGAERFKVSVDDAGVESELCELLRDLQMPPRGPEFTNIVLVSSHGSLLSPERSSPYEIPKSPLNSGHSPTYAFTVGKEQISTVEAFLKKHSVSVTVHREPLSVVNSRYKVDKKNLEGSYHLARTDSVATFAASPLSPRESQSADIRQSIEILDPGLQIYSSDISNLANCVEETPGENVPSPTKALKFDENDWNTRFQTLVELPDSLQKFTELTRLAKDFVYLAETYGRIIIAESFLGPDKKTIQPTDLGGIAGGVKYICQGILFKFALDGNHIYGSDEAAMKSAHNEMRGLMSFFHANVPGLCTPLMALIHYRGYVLIATTVLPISNSSLMYGSNDGGRTVYNTLPELNYLMQTAAYRLKLKERTEYANKERKAIVKVAGPIDLEGHKGRDGRLYVLDFGRVMPPEAPASTVEKGSVFYKHLRPALVLRCEEPLCSDAYSSFVQYDADVTRRQFAEAVRKATVYLHRDVVKAFGWWLSDQPLLPDLEHLVGSAHREGINMRHLGRVRSVVGGPRAPQLKKLLLTECVARTLKNLVRRVLRDHAQKDQVLLRGQRLSAHELVFEYLEPVFFYQTPLSRYLAVGKKEEKLFISSERLMLDTRLSVGDITTVTCDQPVSASALTWYSEFFLERLPDSNWRIAVVCSESDESALDLSSISQYQNRIHFVLDETLLSNDDSGASLGFKEGDYVGLFYDGKQFRVWVNGDISRYAIMNPSWLPAQSPIASGASRVAYAYWPIIQVEAGYVFRANFGTQPFHCNISSYCASIKRPVPSMGRGRHKSSETWWTATIKAELQSRFTNALTVDEMSEGVDSTWRIHSGSLRTLVDIPLLAKRLEKLASLTLSQRVHDALSTRPLKDFSLILHDIEGLHSKVVHMGLIEFAEAAALVLEVKAHQSDSSVDDNPEREKEQLRIALAKVSVAANNAAPVNPAMQFYWGSSLEELAYRTPDKAEKAKLLNEAVLRYRVITEKAHSTMIDDSNNYYARAHLQLGCVTFELAQLTESPLDKASLMNEARKMFREVAERKSVRFYLFELMSQLFCQLRKSSRIGHIFELMRLLFSPLVDLPLTDSKVARAQVRMACATLSYIVGTHGDNSQSLEELRKLPGRGELISKFEMVCTHAARPMAKELSKTFLKDITSGELAMLLDLSLEVKPLFPIMESVLSKEGLVLEDASAALADAVMLFDVKSDCTDAVTRLIRAQLNEIKWDVRDLLIERDRPFNLKVLLAAKSIQQGELRLKDGGRGRKVTDSALSLVLIWLRANCGSLLQHSNCVLLFPEKALRFLVTYNLLPMTPEQILRCNFVTMERFPRSVISPKPSSEHTLGLLVKWWSADHSREAVVLELAAYLDLRTLTHETLRRDLRIAFRLSSSLLSSLEKLLANEPTPPVAEIHFAIPRSISILPQPPVGVLEIFDTRITGTWRVAIVCSRPEESRESEGGMIDRRLTFDIRYIKGPEHDQGPPDETIHLVQDALRIRSATPRSFIRTLTELKRKVPLPRDETNPEMRMFASTYSGGGIPYKGFCGGSICLTDLRSTTAENHPIFSSKVSTFTVEFWMRIDDRHGASSNILHLVREPLLQRHNSNRFLGARAKSDAPKPQAVLEMAWHRGEGQLGKVVVSLIELREGNKIPTLTIEDVPVATWHHYTITYENDGTVDLLFDGKSSDRREVSSASEPLLTFDSVWFGKIDLSANLKLRMREYRLWTLVRKASELLAGMRTELPLPQDGLEQYYKLADYEVGFGDSNLKPPIDHCSGSRLETAVHFSYMRGNVFRDEEPWSWVADESLRLTYQRTDDEPVTFKLIEQNVLSLLCTFQTTGKVKRKQSWYRCLTCTPDEPLLGCCEPCSLCCHFGHELLEQDGDSGFYCSCGADLLGTPCSVGVASATPKKK